MGKQQAEGGDLFIVDNSDSNWKVRDYLHEWCDIAHYHQIVIALHETIRIMTEIDEVIDAHGGWPGAFAAG